MNVIECEKLSKMYGQKKALNELSFTIGTNKITGLIGRNGAGKTTLLKIIAGFIRESSGSIKVFSENPFNNLKISANRIYIDDQMYFPNTLTLKDILQSAAAVYVNWDDELAKRLFSYFTFHPKQHYYHLSKGMKSTFNMILALSAKCPLTILDEPTTGMDSSVRKDFYRALLKDYLEYPRTIILSSHLLNEIEDLLEDILLINEGKELLHMPMADFKEYAIGLQGKEKMINKLIVNKEIIHRKTIGIDDQYLVIKNTLTNEERQRLSFNGITISSVASDDLSTFLTAKTKGGIDDVFNRG
ncbi:ABC transporter [Bacillus sp. 7586-K]|nr:ABC transporter [Bacillus sp. 7586-K]